MREPRFITVDLDIESALSLGNFHSEFKVHHIVLCAELDGEEKRLSVELGSDHSTIESGINSFIDVIETLPASTQDEWQRAKCRVFNIGIESGTGGHEAIVVLESDLVARIASHRAGILVTHYPNADQHRRFSHCRIS